MHISQRSSHFRAKHCREVTAFLLAATSFLVINAPSLGQATAPASPALTPPNVPAQSPDLSAPTKRFIQEIPVSAFKFEMLPVPGSADGLIKPFFIAKTELTWEAFDVYVYRLDEEAGKAPKHADAVTRPSKPYLPPDRGYGHDGFAAISMSFKNAKEFCVWLSAHTGRNYRLPTEAEWEHAARATSNAAQATSSSPTGTCVPAGATIAAAAWHSDNSADAPHPVGTLAPNALGIHDMLGNVAEWVVGTDGKPVTKGGSFRDPADKLTVFARTPQSSAWNSSDPQIPKSVWWLADAPFVGFRIVCDDAPPSQPHDTNASPK
jgi:hypothetical protein